jgi:hypothetical protein
VRRKTQQGVASVEFALSSLVLVPLLLGSIGIGLCMHQQMETVQLARDAGHMYARDVDFGLTGNQQLLVTIAGALGLSTTAGSGSAVVILSQVRYVDVSACTLAGKVDIHGNPSGCSNYQHWVFAQRLVVGNSSVRASSLGTPNSLIIGTDGAISITNQVTNTTDVAAITGFNPWNSTSDTGLPSGQVIYVTEAAATGFSMPPYVNAVNTYSQVCF